MLSVQSLTSSAFSTPRLIFCLVQLSQLLIWLNPLLDVAYFSCCLRGKVSVFFSFFCISWALLVFLKVSFHFSAPQNPHNPFPPFFTTPIPFILLHFIITVTLFDSFLPVSFSLPRLLLSNSLFMSSSLQISPRPDSIQATVASLMLRIWGWQPLACTVTTWSFCTWGTHIHTQTLTHTCVIWRGCSLAGTCTPPFAEIKPTLPFFLFTSVFITSWISWSHGPLHFFSTPQQIYEFNPSLHPPPLTSFPPTALCSLMPLLLPIFAAPV